MTPDGKVKWKFFDARIGESLRGDAAIQMRIGRTVLLSE